MTHSPTPPDGGQTVDLRDRFAGQALNGLMASIGHAVIDDLKAEKINTIRAALRLYQDAISIISYGIADAMLAQRDKDKERKP